MKKLYLPALLTFIATSAFAQKNADFGFVLQAGNFTTSNNRTEHQYYLGNVSSTFLHQNAGSAYAVGIRKSIRFGGYFRISADILYRMASFSTSYTNSSGPIGADPTSTYIQSQQVSESSIAIPVKLHLSLKKNGNTSIVLGAGLSRIVHSNFKANYDSKNILSPQYDNAYRYPDLNLGMRDFKPVMMLTAGFYHSINKSTSLGVEFTYERRSEDVRYASTFKGINGVFIDCLCYGYLYLKTPSMRSLSVSLSHNLSK